METKKTNVGLHSQNLVTISTIVVIVIIMSMCKAAHVHTRGSCEHVRTFGTGPCSIPQEEVQLHLRDSDG